MTEETIDPLADKYRQYMEINDAWADAELPAGYERHASYLLERMRVKRERGESAVGHGYALMELHFLANEGELLSDDEFDRHVRSGLPIPYDSVSQRESESGRRAR
jgi:hypothetical protein